MENQTKIMVVDDELGICKNVEKILVKNNYSVVHTQSAEHALEMMKNESFSLLISDIVMPGMNGLELLREVTKKSPNTKTVMMTGYASTDTAVKAIRLGALDYIPKPFTPDELRTTVNKALTGELTQMNISEEQRDAIEIMDIDIDLGKEVQIDFATIQDNKTIVDEPEQELEFHCGVGDMICDVMEKLGATCKTGLKKNYCPKIKAMGKKRAKDSSFNHKTMIGIDQPFDYNEVAAITGPEYIHNLSRDGFAFLPYEELKKLQPVKGEAQKEKTFDSAKASKIKNILVVDDEVAVNNNIRKILDKNDFQIDQAMTSDQAIEKIHETSYSLVLLDLRMPGVTGLELLETISEIQPLAKVIIITGYASIDTAIESARIGAINYLPKPFTPDELRNITEQTYAMAV